MYCFSAKLYKIWNTITDVIMYAQRIQRRRSRLVRVSMPASKQQHTRTALFFSSFTISPTSKATCLQSKPYTLPPRQLHFSTGPSCSSLDCSRANACSFCRRKSANTCWMSTTTGAGAGAGAGTTKTVRVPCPCS